MAFKSFMDTDVFEAEVCAGAQGGADAEILGHVTTTQLRILSHLLRVESTTETAVRFNISQPSGSRLLADMRIRFPDRLLVRSGVLDVGLAGIILLGSLAACLAAIHSGSPLVGVLAAVQTGLAGAYVIAKQTGIFRDTVVLGRGFIPLGIFILARWPPALPSQRPSAALRWMRCRCLCNGSVPVFPLRY